MSILPLAFFLGLMGSLHCAVMCGPLMLSLPLQKSGFLKSAFHLFSYQIGRTLTYTCLGFFIGLIGSSLKFFATQEILSFSIGLVMITYTIIYFFRKKISFFDRVQQKMINPISKLMGKIYGLTLWGFFAGMLNGLIPCGMVYLALASALNAGSITESTKFMLLFGLGTMPLMTLVSLGGIYIRNYFRFSPNKLLPFFMLLMGILFVLRSQDLGVPYLSPSKNITPNGHVVTCE